jgi:hypothetical protein
MPAFCSVRIDKLWTGIAVATEQSFTRNDVISH